MAQISGVLINLSTGAMMKSREGIEHLIAYPTQELWRLFVDGNMVGAKNEKGFYGYEKREPGSLVACFEGFKAGLVDFDNPHISHDLICRIHDACTKKVDFKENTKDFVSGKYAKSPRMFNFTLAAKHRYSPEGIQDFLQSLLTNEQVGFDREKAMEIALEKNLISKEEELDDLLQTKPFKEPMNERERAINYLLYAAWRGPKLSAMLNDIDPEETYCALSIRMHLDAYPDKSEEEALKALSKYIYAKICEDGKSYNYYAPHHSLIEAKMQEIIDSYNEKISAIHNKLDKEQTTKVDKEAASFNDEILRVILEHIRQLELLHPFIDGNGRTFVNVLCNRLLMQQGYPPCTFYDPNIFDLKSIDQIIECLTIGDSEEVKENKKKVMRFISSTTIDEGAFNHTLQLINGEKMPANRDTQKIVSMYGAEDPEFWPKLLKEMTSFHEGVKEMLHKVEKTPSFYEPSVSFFKTEKETVKFDTSEKENLNLGDKKETPHLAHEPTNKHS